MAQKQITDDQLDGIAGSKVTGAVSLATTVTTNANLSGDVTSSGNTTTLANTAVTPGSYTSTNLTVDSKGRITAASNGSGGGSGTVTSVDMSVPAFLSVSGNPITTTGTLAVTLSGTALPIANGGTGQTAQTAAFDALAPTTTKGDIIVSNGTDNIRVAVGTDTHVLTADSTTASGVKWAAGGGGGGGSSFPVGAIIQTPSAPTGDGTWLACDGSAVSQSTYSSLYSAIGTKFARYIEKNAPFNNTSVNMGGVTYIGDGKWMSNVSASTNTGYISTTGTTWSASGTFPSSTTWVGVFGQNLSGVVLRSISTASTTGARSTDYGSTWSSWTMPFNGNVGRIQWNGTYFVAVNGTTSLWYSTDGASWTSAGAVLPGNTERLEWDGTYWIAASTISLTYKIYRTSVSTGASGWTTVSDDKITASFREGACNTSGVSIGAAFRNSGRYLQFVRTTDGFSTVSTIDLPFPYFPQVSQLIPGIHWTGRHFVINWLSYYSISVDGISWETYATPTMSTQEGAAQAAASDNYGDTATGGAAGTYYKPFNPTTGDWMFTTAWIPAATAYTATQLLKLNYNISTEFPLPLRPGSYIKVST